jgi:beta-N-acetylhexosaminidase
MKKKKKIIATITIIILIGIIFFINDQTILFTSADYLAKEVPLLTLTPQYLISKQIVLNKMKQENTDNLVIEDGVIEFGSLTMRQKLSQMIMIRGDDEKNIDYVKLGIGGIFLDKLGFKDRYKSLIERYQERSRIKLFASTDLEGAWDPYRDIDFLEFSEIKDKEEAYRVGKEHGEVLKDTGFNLNFAPVAEYTDKSYGGRVFLGSKEEVKEKLIGYIKGLQENVMGTCKHYPGKGMIKNLHDKRDRQVIDKEDLGLFKVCIDNNISAIMVGHQIVEGMLDSKGKPSSVSKEVIESLKDFKGLIVSDEINMRGLKSFYYFNKRGLYRDLINSGEEIILYFYLSPEKLYNLLLKLEKDVEKGLIDKERVDRSVKKILKAKGYEIKI